MKKSMIAAAILVAGTINSQAADPYNWSGVYGGVNFGYGVGRNSSRDTQFNLPHIVYNNELFDLSPSGMLGGLQAGVNWQVARWVFGIEGDVQLSAQTDKSFCGDNCSFYSGTFIPQKLPWFATVRGRVGYAADTTLFYATGGLAIARVETAATTYDAPPVQYFPFGVSTNRVGWTLGAGIEAAISGPWTAKIEYLYFDLGDVAGSGRTGGPGSEGQVSSAIRDNVIRVGLNYRLGVQPNAETHPSAHQHTSTSISENDWNGLYVGVNGGYGIAHNPIATTLIDFSGNPSETFMQSPAGGLVGAQVGYNWQRNRWLFGVESDLQYAAQTSSSCVYYCVVGQALTVDQSIRWFGTTRGRIGFIEGNSLFYATAGLAYGQIMTSGRFQDGVGSPALAYSSSVTRSGWVLGGGIESKIAPNWSIKAEYLYMDLGNTAQVVPGIDDGFPVSAPLSSELHDHIMRVGLNYTFGNSGL